MASDKRRLSIISITLLLGVLVTAGIIQNVQAREGYIMNLILGALHDVILDNPISGQVLTYNGTYWINQNVTTGGGVTSLTSNNNAITLNASSGDILISPKWELLCQNSLGASATSISCSNFPVRKYIIVHAELKIVTNSVGIAYRFNSDSGTNYSWRQSINGGADTTGTSDTECTLSSTSANGGANIFLVINNNLSTDRKLSNTLWGAGLHDNSGTAPSRIENVCKWDNTSNSISTIAFIRESGTGEYNTNTRLTVWGYD